MPEPTSEELKNYESSRPKREETIALSFDKTAISLNARDVKTKLMQE
jgi:hypothetical protein